MEKNISRNIRIEFETVSNSYEICIGSSLLNEIGTFARGRLNESTKKICLFSNPKVFALYGEQVSDSLVNSGFEVVVFLMKDGERYKDLRSLENALKFFSEKKLTRTDAVVALGGGVVGDLAGFASAVYLRGISFIQVPTTVLAQIDSSVGGKTGINSDFGKNLIGAFHQPSGVLVDIETLKTLSKRELTAGFYEIIKHGALSGTVLFEQTQTFLQNFPLKIFLQHFSKSQFVPELENLIAANIAFKAEIVAGDERENFRRDDVRSRKILNFGHTVGHALENLTNYRRFKHGEAVAYGMLVASKISERLGKLSKHKLILFNEVLLSLGKLPDASDISPEKVIEAFAQDKKAAGDSFKWILLEDFGRASIVDNKNIPQDIVRDALRSVLNDPKPRSKEN